MIFQAQKVVYEDSNIIGCVDIDGDFIGDNEGSEYVLFSDHLIFGFDVVGSGLNDFKSTSTASLQSPFPFLVYCLQKSLATDVTYDMTCLA